MKKYCIFLVFCSVSLLHGQLLEKLTSIAYYGYNGLAPRNLTVFKDKLYFFGTDDNKLANMLMVYDDATNKTTRVLQIDTMKKYPGIYNLTVFGNMLLFHDNYTSELWGSDGTPGGTAKIKNVGVSTSAGFAVMNGKAYFAGVDPAKPGIDQLWVTDGTGPGTKLVKTINPSGGAGIGSLFAWNGQLYFSATNGTNKKQIWQSDGTEIGTNMLKILNATDDANPRNFIVYNSKLYFTAAVKGYASQVFVTDGTPGGTKQFTYVNTTYSSGMNPQELIVYNNLLYFSGYDTNFYAQLWRTDGTPTGTVKVKWNYRDAGTRGLIPSSFAIFKGKLYFSGYDSILSTQQLWVSDGTTEGTQLVTKYGYNFGPSKITSLGNYLVMVAGDSASKKAQVFATTGTQKDMVMPKVPDDWSSAPLYPIEKFVEYHNALYYCGAYAVFSDYQLCRFTEYPANYKGVKMQEMGLYPNPAKDFIRLENQTLSKLQILDLYGRTIRNLPASSDLIDISDLSNGIYFIKGTNQNGEIFQSKFLKTE